MMGTFTEAVFGFMEIAWLMVIAGFVFLTIPIWLIPFAVFKVWKWREQK